MNSILLPEVGKKEHLLPVVPLRETVVFPHTEMGLSFGRQKSIAALESAWAKDKLICFVLQKDRRLDDPNPEQFTWFGTMCTVERILKTDREMNVIVKGVHRVKIGSIEQFTPYFTAKVVEVPEEPKNDDEIKALVNHIVAQFRRAVNLGKSIDLLSVMNVMSYASPHELTDQVANSLDIKASEKQELLEEGDIKKRLDKINEFLTHEVKVLELGRKIASKTQDRLSKSNREAILREQLKSIEEELGDTPEGKEVEDYREKIRKAKMPQEVQEKAEKELKRLSTMSAYNPEASYVRTYLDWLCELPWTITEKSAVDIKKAQKILDEDHYGLEKVKERIIEYLAVHKLAGKMKGSILCFAGPPGTGKTSIGRSIARAMQRKFVKMSLGGIRDEAEIRGHRRTYVGALPGRIIQSLKTAGTRNPVFMLDEIDKVGADFRGDPSAALLEALDPEQNHAFSDHYLEVPYDLSDVMFITTANILETIPPALRDRLEGIRFSGYTEEEKFHIGVRHLLTKQKEAHGLKESQLDVSDAAFHAMIQSYTRESGVRNLERELASLCRKAARKIVEKKVNKVIITDKNLSKFLGPEKFEPLLPEKKDTIGMSTGLAVTEAGGEILFVEVALVPGKGKLLLTGQLGDVMKESCYAALSFVRSRAEKLGIDKNFLDKTDVHVHVPAGAVPKDGPSAGVAIVTALVSALTKVPVRRDIGMTGEITLRGRALEIGGVKSKVLAAHRAGIKTVILPRSNKKDLVELTPKVRKELTFVFADQVDQVLKVALNNSEKGKVSAGTSSKASQKKKELV